jgi:tyrosine-protein kinase
VLPAVANRHFAAYTRAMTTPSAAPGGRDELTPAERASPHLRSLLRYSWLVLLVVVVAVAAAVEVSTSQPKKYDATASVLLTNSEPVNVLLKSTGLPSADPERDLNTDVSLVKVDAIAQQVRRQLKLPWTTTRLLKEVAPSLVGTSNVVAITVRDLVPARAAAIANAFAARYVIFRRQSAQSTYHAAAALALKQISELTPAQLKSPTGVALQQQYQQLQVAGDLQTGTSQLVDRAELPTTPATPRPKFDGAVAGIVGLMIGALLAIALGAIRKPKLKGAALAVNGDVADADRLPSGASADSPRKPEPAAAVSAAVSQGPSSGWRSR